MENQNEEIAAEGEGEEEETEEIFFSYVPYIHNGFILKHMTEHGNSSAAQMVLDLPLCHNDDKAVMTACLSRLKKKRETLGKNKSKSSEGAAAFQHFLDAEFVFPTPLPLATQRFKIFSIRIWMC